MSITEEEYDRIINEGGEGYNPIRAERERRELEAEVARPKSIFERRDALLRELNRKNSSLARECGTYDQAEVDAIRSELKALDEEEHGEFLKTWTLETTKERRASWNSRIKSGELTPKNAAQAQMRQGWTTEELKKAICIHRL